MLRVLICDDEADTRELLAEALQMRGLFVDVVSDGASAVARVLQGDIDAVVIDIGLPDMSGYDVVRAIRGYASRLEIQLIAITGYVRDEDHEKALGAGFNQWFAKPLKVDTLLAALKRGMTEQ